MQWKFSLYRTQSPCTLYPIMIIDTPVHAGECSYIHDVPYILHAFSFSMKYIYTASPPISHMHDFPYTMHGVYIPSLCIYYS